MKINVEYHDCEPTELDYFHPTFGMVKFHMDGSTAVIDEKFNELTDRHLKDGFELPLSTEDVIEEVRQLPFVDEVKV